MNSFTDENGDEAKEQDVDPPNVDEPYAIYKARRVKHYFTAAHKNEVIDPKWQGPLHQIFDKANHMNADRGPYDQFNTLRLKLVRGGQTNSKIDKMRNNLECDNAQIEKGEKKGKRAKVC